MRDAWALTAAELAAAYATSAVTPESALQSVLGRIEAANPELNAVVTLPELTLPPRLRDLVGAPASHLPYTRHRAQASMNGIIGSISARFLLLVSE